LIDSKPPKCRVCRGLLIPVSRQTSFVQSGPRNIKFRYVTDYWYCEDCGIRYEKLPDEVIIVRSKIVDYGKLILDKATWDAEPRASND
jgi:hypothetical protein